MRQKIERKAIVLFIFLTLSVIICPALGESVQLDLFTIGCPSLFEPNHSWSSDIDLGVQFSQIDHVYIDWAGEITAGIAVDNDDPGNPYPLDVGIAASLGGNPWPRATNIWGGETTYPAAEPFDSLSEFSLLSNSTWSDLLDGQGTITMGYGELILLDGVYIENGSITLTEATLIVDGIIIPEPATLLLLGLGGLFLRKK